MVKPRRASKEDEGLFDPVTVLFNRLKKEVINLTYSVWSSEDQPHLETLVETTTLVMELQTLYQEKPQFSISFIVTNFRELEKLLETVLGELEKAIGVDIRCSKEWGDEVMAVAWAEFVLLQAKVETLTPSHLALQTHHYSILKALSSGQTLTKDLERCMKFFSPLSKLRDKYFDQPRADLLSEYLSMSDELVKAYCIKSALSDERRKEVQAKTNGYAVELETAILMDAFL